MRKLGPYVENAVACLGIDRDARGLMPLREARRRIRAAKVFERGGYHSIPGQVAVATDADFLWGALMSLADGEEFVREARRLTWKFSPRGFDNIAPVERYGDAVLPWLDAAIDAQGRLPPNPWCIRPCLIALGPAAVRAVLRLRDPRDGDPAALGALREWLDRHGSLGWSALAEEAQEGDERALAALEVLARRSPLRVKKALGARASVPSKASRDLQPSAITAALDAAASAPIGDRVPWPTIHAHAGHLEYHALRLIAARAVEGDDWGVLIEVVHGDVLDRSARWPAVVQRYVYGSNVAPGGRYLADARPLPIVVKGARVTKPVRVAIDANLAKRFDLRPGRSITGAVSDWTAVLAIRAALAAKRAALWPPPKVAARALRLARPQILISTFDFEHVDGPEHGAGRFARLPSRVRSYRTLAEAIAARDPARFDPGVPNTDWRLHAKRKQPFDW